MDIVSKNPFRILGVFADDPIRVRTANTGKICAYAKIGKEISFNIDAISVFGALPRTLDDVNDAKAKLSVKTDEAIYAFFWFHHNSELSSDNADSKLNNRLSKI